MTRVSRDVQVTVTVEEALPVPSERRTPRATAASIDIAIVQCPISAARSVRRLIEDV
jgi:hypothetical protein